MHAVNWPAAENYESDCKTIDFDRDMAQPGNLPSLFDMFLMVKQPHWTVSGLSPARTGSGRPPSGPCTHL